MPTWKLLPYVPPVEDVVVWRGGFTEDECDKIIELGEVAEFMKAKVGSSVEGGEENTAIRETDIVWIRPSEDTAWLFRKLADIVTKINFDKFQLDLEAFDGFQYSKYNENGHYDWHVDTWSISPDANFFRKLSVSLLLSHPEEYENGELLLSPNGNNLTPMILKPKKGDIVVFYSHTPHKVTRVTKGTRISLVTWCLGNKLK